MLTSCRLAHSNGTALWVSRAPVAVWAAYSCSWGNVPVQVCSSRRPPCKATAAACAAASGYWTLSEPYTLETEVKRSRFIATAWPVTSVTQALELVAAASDPDASHNCYALRVAGTARSSDDGEPSGTAGRPILGAIAADGLENVCVLVVRHFGGVKLGAGGLVRAYGGAARDCVRAAPKLFVPARVVLVAEVLFADLGAVYNVISRHGAVAGEENYEVAAAAGRVQLLIMADADALEPLTMALADATSGRVHVERQEDM